MLFQDREQFRDDGVCKYTRLAYNRHRVCVPCIEIPHFARGYPAMARFHRPEGCRQHAHDTPATPGALGSLISYQLQRLADGRFTTFARTATTALASASSACRPDRSRHDRFCQPPPLWFGGRGASLRRRSPWIRACLHPGAGRLAQRRDRHSAYVFASGSSSSLARAAATAPSISSTLASPRTSSTKS